MATVHLPDGQWAFIQPLLPPPVQTGRPRFQGRVNRSFMGAGLVLPGPLADLAHVL
ncbi:MAG TPA: hypothetical protein VF040_04365 [Ktedonobacterales bacterium]